MLKIDLLHIYTGHRLSLKIDLLHIYTGRRLSLKLICDRLAMELMGSHSIPGGVIYS